MHGFIGTQGEIGKLSTNLEPSKLSNALLVHRSQSYMKDRVYSVDGFDPSRAPLTSCSEALECNTIFVK